MSHESALSLSPKTRLSEELMSFGRDSASELAGLELDVLGIALRCSVAEVRLREAPAQEGGDVGYAPQFAGRTVDVPFELRALRAGKTLGRAGQHRVEQADLVSLPSELVDAEQGEQVEPALERELARQRRRGFGVRKNLVHGGRPARHQVIGEERKMIVRRELQSRLAVAVKLRLEPRFERDGDAAEDALERAKLEARVAGTELPCRGAELQPIVRSFGFGRG